MDLNAELSKVEMQIMKHPFRVVGLALGATICLALWILTLDVENRVPPSPVIPGVELDSGRAMIPDVGPVNEGSPTLDRVPQTTGRKPEEIVPFQDLLVQVVNESGGVVEELPLRITAEKESDRWVEGDLRGVTDVRGQTVFRNVRALLASGNGFRLSHEVCFDVPPTVLLNASALSQPKVVTVQPPSGEIEVLVVDSDAFRPDEFEVELILLPNVATIRERLSSKQERRAWTRETRGGRTSFSWVELGREWRVTARRAGSSMTTTVAMAGPHADREMTSVSLKLDMNNPVFEYRAIGSAGEPMALRSLEIARYCLAGGGESLRCLTDEKGRFRVSGGIGPEGASILIVSTRAVDGSSLVGRTNMRAATTPGVRVGGDVVLTVPPLLVAGRVLDEAGLPIAEARVKAMVSQGVMPDSILTPSRMETVSDGQGNFVISGLVAFNDCRVWAQLDSMQSEKVLFEKGTKDLVLVLRDKKLLTGRVRLPPDVPPKSIALTVRSEAAEAQKQISIRPEDSGKFAARVDLGTYKLEVMVGAILVATIDNITIKSDVDIGTVELSGNLRACTINLVDAHGSVNAVGRIAWRPTGKQIEWQETDFNGSVVGLTATTGPIDIWLRPVRYREALLQGVEENREVFLTEALKIRLVINTTGALPAPPYYLEAELRQGTRIVGFPEYSEGFAEKEKSLDMLVSNPGAVEVHWRLERRVGDMSVGGEVLVDYQRVIEIADVEVRQVFDFNIDSQALTELRRSPPW